MTALTDLWLREFHPGPGTGARLICFPHAGGSASAFLPLSQLLSPELDIQAVQYPGRQDRRAEPPIGTIEDLARELFAVLRAHTDDRPLAFFGHSMGALVAFELARLLERDGDRPPVRLFLSGRRAPSAERAGNKHPRSDAAIIAQLRELNGTDARLLDDEEIVQMVLPALRADYAAVDAYQGSDAQVSCPITALTGDGDPQVTPDEARAWRNHTTSESDLHIFTGGHFYLFQHLRAIGDLIAGRLEGPGTPRAAVAFPWGECH
ncbi:MAG TPA: alpha/beta fold hydrolase [Trebonia sp.]|jgi:surfactin synthase thioesterase subunit|nr:alpha/beta fold hydrolase [Trebonia sp.]